MLDNIGKSHDSKNINYSSGKTTTEQKLTNLCKKTFLSLWSYSNPYYELNRELCDVLIVCSNSIIIFSDKNITFPKTNDLNIGWKRWRKKAIIGSVKQLKGAEACIRNHPDKIYLDAKCQKSIPIPCPSDKNTKIYLIAVANGATKNCKEYSSGSLKFAPSSAIEGLPFTIGDENPSGTFVHIFDDYTLPIILQELDTIMDFIQYLDEKESFIRSVKHITYSGEEDLLAHYLAGYDESKKKHTFLPSFCNVNNFTDSIIVDGGQWEEIRIHPQYINKKQADEISYIWDRLIEKFGKNILSGKTNRHGPSVKEHEGGIRYMALEPRFFRRVLSTIVKEVVESYDHQKPVYSITRIESKSQQGLLYLFVQFPNNMESAYIYEQYGHERLNHIYKCVMAAKSTFPEFIRIIGISTEPPKICLNTRHSEDLILLDSSITPWTEEKQKEGERYRKELNIFTIHNQKFINVKNYPD